MQNLHEEVGASAKSQHRPVAASAPKVGQSSSHMSRPMAARDTNRLPLRSSEAASTRRPDVGKQKLAAAPRLALGRSDAARTRREDVSRQNIVAAPRSKVAPHGRSREENRRGGRGVDVSRVECEEDSVNRAGSRTRKLSGGVSSKEKAVRRNRQVVDGSFRHVPTRKPVADLTELDAELEEQSSKPRRATANMRLQQEDLEPPPVPAAPQSRKRLRPPDDGFVSVSGRRAGTREGAPKIVQHRGEENPPDSQAGAPRRSRGGTWGRRPAVSLADGWPEQPTDERRRPDRPAPEASHAARAARLPEPPPARRRSRDEQRLPAELRRTDNRPGEGRAGGDTGARRRAEEAADTRGGGGGASRGAPSERNRRDGVPVSRHGQPAWKSARR